MIARNFYWDGNTSRRIEAGKATSIAFGDTGTISLRVASENDAESEIGWRDALTVFNSGRVGIGTITPGSKFVVQGIASDASASSLNVRNSNNNSLFFVRDDGKVGIGTTSVLEKLHIHDGTIKLTGDGTVWSGWRVALDMEAGSAMRTQIWGTYPIMNGYSFGYGITTTGWYWIIANGPEATATHKYPMSLTVDNCGIPTLSIQKESWCDFVFDENYKRPSFEEQELFLKTNKHLKGIASEKEIAENGLDVTGTMQGITLNVEEMKLDMIELYKRLLKLETENEELKKQIEVLKK